MNKTPEPVLSRAAVAAVITAVVAALKAFGVEVPADVSEAVVNLVIAVAPIVAIVWAAWTARKRVAPLDYSEVGDEHEARHI